jgi:hypothetical protein
MTERDDPLAEAEAIARLVAVGLVAPDPLDEAEQTVHDELHALAAEERHEKGMAPLATLASVFARPARPEDLSPEETAPVTAPAARTDVGRTPPGPALVALDERGVPIKPRW